MSDHTRHTNADSDVRKRKFTTAKVTPKQPTCPNTINFSKCHSFFPNIAILHKNNHFVQMEPSCPKVTTFNCLKTTLCPNTTIFSICNPLCPTTNFFQNSLSKFHHFAHTTILSKNDALSPNKGYFLQFNYNRLVQIQIMRSLSQYSRPVQL